MPFARREINLLISEWKSERLLAHSCENTGHSSPSQLRILSRHVYFQNLLFLPPDSPSDLQHSAAGSPLNCCMPELLLVSPRICNFHRTKYFFFFYLSLNLKLPIFKSASATWTRVLQQTPLSPPSRHSFLLLYRPLSSVTRM